MPVSSVDHPSLWTCNIVHIPQIILNIMINNFLRLLGQLLLAGVPVTLWRLNVYGLVFSSFFVDTCILHEEVVHYVLKSSLFFLLRWCSYSLSASEPLSYTSSIPLSKSFYGLNHLVVPLLWLIGHSIYSVVTCSTAECLCFCFFYSSPQFVCLLAEGLKLD